VALGQSGCRQGTRRHESFERTSDQLHVVTIGALNGERQWNAGSFRQQAALDALLAPVHRVRPGFFEPESGTFVMAPSMGNQDQSIPFSSSYSICSHTVPVKRHPSSFVTSPISYTPFNVPMGAISAEMPPTEIRS
jgi:hypothetical protein